MEEATFMDDNLETPTALPQAALGDNPPDENDAQLSDEEEGALDWTKLLPASARPVIPRRGEKEFEPRSGGGTNLQLHVLDRSRAAMFDTLRATRTISSKAVSYATWCPDISRTHVTVARGIHFSSMGHSAPREVSGEDGLTKIQKRLELLPEEAIYLIERGSLFCWKQSGLHSRKITGLDNMDGTPMTVQQALSEMIDKEDLTLEKFQVYAYLKRLGYVVTRTDPPDDYYPLPPKFAVAKPYTSIIQRINSLFPLWNSLVSRMFRSFNWWKPIGISCWLQRDKNYASLFRSMRFIPAGYSIPLKPSESTQRARLASPYRIFFNVWKPSTPFKKSSPPPPDFQLVVVNARTTPMPSLQELADLFDMMPEAPLPPPRQRRTQPLISNGSVVASQAPTIPTQNKTSGSDKSFIRRTFPWFFPSQSTLTPPAPIRKPNPFVALKTGKKIVIVAAVDSGNTSFFRFGQGEFTAWPMVG